MFSAALYARVRNLYPLHTGPRVQRASDIPCLPQFFEGDNETQDLGQIVPRERGRVFDV